MSDTSTSGTSTKVSVGSTTTTVLAADAHRRFAEFTNDSDEFIYLSTSGTAVMNTGIPLEPHGGSYELEKGENMVTGLIAAICSSGTKNLCVEYH